MAATVKISTDTSGVDLTPLVKQFQSLGQSQVEAVRSAQALKKELDSRETKKFSDAIKKVADEYDGTATAARRVANEARQLSQQSARDAVVRRQQEAERNHAQQMAIAATRQEAAEMRALGLEAARASGQVEAFNRKTAAQQEAMGRGIKGRLDASQKSADSEAEQKAAKALAKQQGVAFDDGSGGKFAEMARTLNATNLAYGHELQVRQMGSMLDKIPAKWMSIASAIGGAGVAVAGVVAGVRALDAAGSGAARQITRGLSGAWGHTKQSAMQWGDWATSKVDDAFGMDAADRRGLLREDTMNQRVESTMERSRRMDAINRDVSTDPAYVQKAREREMNARSRQQVQSRQIGDINELQTSGQVTRFLSMEERDYAGRASQRAEADAARQRRKTQLQGDLQQSSTTLEDIAKQKDPLAAMDGDRRTEHQRNLLAELSQREADAKARQVAIQKELLDIENKSQRSNEDRIAQEERIANLKKRQSDILRDDMARDADRKRQMEGLTADEQKILKARYDAEDAERARIDAAGGDKFKIAQIQKDEAERRKLRDDENKFKGDIFRQDLDRQTSLKSIEQERFATQSEQYRKQKESLEDQIRQTKRVGGVLTPGDEARVAELAKKQAEAKKQELAAEKEIRELRNKGMDDAKQRAKTDDELRQNRRDKEKAIKDDERRDAERAKRESIAEENRRNAVLQDEAAFRRQQQLEVAQQSQQQFMTQAGPGGTTGQQKIQNLLGSRKGQQAVRKQLVEDRLKKTGWFDEKKKLEATGVDSKRIAAEERKRRATERRKLAADAKGPRRDKDAIREERQRLRDRRKSSLGAADEAGLDPQEKKRIRMESDQDERRFRQRVRGGEFDRQGITGEENANAQGNVLKDIAGKAEKGVDLQSQQGSQISSVVQAATVMAQKQTQVEGQLRQANQEIQQLWNVLKSKL